jgi:hypothetical protein
VTIGKHSSKVSGVLAAILLLAGNIPAYAIFLPVGGTASVQRFDGIWKEEEEDVQPVNHPKLSYSPVVLDLARVIGRFRGAPGYATEQDPLEEERSIINKKSGSLRLPPFLSQEPNLTPEAAEPKDPLSLDVPPINVESVPPLGTPHSELAPIVASALTARVRPAISNGRINTNIDNSFLLWTLQPSTTGGDNGWYHDFAEPYRGTFIECAPGARIKSMLADKVVVESGRMLISNRGASLKIVTAAGEVTLPPESSMILDCTKDTLRVMALECRAEGISILREGRLLAELNKGYEASVDAAGQATNNKISVSQLLSSDQLLRGDHKLDAIQKSALAELKSRLVDERQVSK